MNLYCKIVIVFLLALLHFHPGVHAQTRESGPKGTKTASDPKKRKNLKKASRDADAVVAQWQGNSPAQDSVAPSQAPAFQESESEWEAFGEVAGTDNMTPRNSSDSVQYTTDMLPVSASGETALSTDEASKPEGVPVLSWEEKEAIRQEDLRQARRKLDKNAPTYIRDLARINFQQEYPMATQLMEPAGSEEIVFTFWTQKGPALATYDEKGEWTATVSLLNNNQLPAPILKLFHDLDMDILQFEDKFKIEARDVARPVYALYTSQRSLVSDTALLNEKGDLLPHIVAGVGVLAEGKHFILGSSIHEVLPEKLSFLSLMVSADGRPIYEKDITRLLEEGLMLFPSHYSLLQWNPGGSWGGTRKDWFKCPAWEPEYTRWYPEQEWFVETVW